MEWNAFSNFGRGSPKEHFRKIILKSVQWSRRRCHLKVFSIFSSGCHFVLTVEQNNFSNFGRGSPKDHFRKIILKLGIGLKDVI